MDKPAHQFYESPRFQLTKVTRSNFVLKIKPSTVSLNMRPNAEISNDKLPGQSTIVV